MTTTLQQSLKELESDQEKYAIIKAYMEYFDAYTKREWDKMVSYFANGFTMIGTGKDEYATNSKDTLLLYKREFSQAPQNIETTLKNVNVHPITNDIAYVTIVVEMRTEVGSEIFKMPNNRTSAIMIKEKGQWKLLHGHWSEASVYQEEGESWPFKVLVKKTEELEQKVKERTHEIEAQKKKIEEISAFKTKLLQIIAHDLRSPFNAFMGLTEILNLRLKSDNYDEEFLKKTAKYINESAQSLFSVTDNLLNWAKYQQDNLTINWQQTLIPKTVKEQVAAVLEIARQKQITIIEKIAPDLVWETDYEMLATALRNLLLNAIKFSHRGGEIIVSSMASKTKLQLTVQDFGKGMTKDELDCIKQDCQLIRNPGTEDEPGTGLGIQICKSLVRFLHGHIEFESKLGEGTSIHLIFENRQPC
jgi:signal transduction histidine kinase